MTNRIAVGTPVNVSSKYGQHAGRNDLVVLSDQGTGYGVGPKGNDPAKSHNGAEGWLYYSDSSSRVTPKKESKTVTQFNKGDKVEILDDYMSAKKGDTLTVTESGSWHTYATHDATGVLMGAYNSRFKLVEEPAAIKVGDTVKVISKSMSYYGRTGTVTSLDSGYTAWPITVRFDGNGEPSYAASELELVTPKGFTFKDIQKGDTIRRTTTYKGATEVREGIVGTEGSYYWATEQGNYILAYDTDGRESITDVTLELLNRPEPEPTLLENTKIGDKLVIRYKSGSTKVYTKARHDGECWDTLVIYSNGKATKGAWWSNTELEEFAASQSAESTDLITK